MLEVDNIDLIPLHEVEYIKNNISENFVKIEDNKIFINKIKITDLEKIPNFNNLLKQNKLSYNIKSKYRIYFDYKKDNKILNKSNNKNIRKMSFYNTEIKKEKENILSKEYKNNIICDDSLNVLKKIPSNSIDMILTSPPYNFGINYNEYNDVNKWNDYFKKMDEIIKELFRILKYGGRVIWNIQPFYNEYVPSHHIFSQIFLKNKFIWRNEILWEKNNYSARYTSWGSWLSSSSPYLKYTWEFIEVFSKGSIKKDNGSKISDLTPEEFKKYTIGKWNIAPERNMKHFNHDAMFPEELARRSIKLFSFVGDIILDPFNGVGTTTKVAYELNRIFLGIDISKEYCETAKKRLKEFKND